MKNQMKLILLAKVGLVTTVLLVVLFALMFPNVTIGDGGDKMLENIANENSFEGVQRRSTTYVSLLLSATKMSNNLVLLLFTGLCMNGVLLCAIYRKAKNDPCASDEASGK